MEYLSLSLTTASGRIHRSTHSFLNPSIPSPSNALIESIGELTFIASSHLIAFVLKFCLKSLKAGSSHRARISFHAGSLSQLLKGLVSDTSIDVLPYRVKSKIEVVRSHERERKEIDVLPLRVKSKIDVARRHERERKKIDVLPLRVKSKIEVVRSDER